MSQALPAPFEALMRGPRIGVQCAVFLTLLGSYAFFWHSRDWNTTSRLILTYAMADRGTVCLDGLENQTGDIAQLGGHYYGDKLPGFSLVATIPYLLARWTLGLPSHPLGQDAMAYWPADYWVTLGTSGLFTALVAVLLLRLAHDLGCSERQGALVGLAYGLATPAYVYATLAYGHQLTAFALFGALYLLWKTDCPREAVWLGAAGLLAAAAAVIELQVAPVVVVLGVYLLVQCLSGRRKPEAIVYFALGAAVPTLFLLGYNLLAFGSPWDMGYFHHATAQFARVHNRQNPLGLRMPDPALIGPLLWGEHRGLLCYAPILWLSVPGWYVLASRRQTGLCVVSLACALAVFVVNLSYPEWTGGWSTGPRLLVPLLPFAMIPVAAVLAVAGPWSRAVFRLAVFLAAAGATLMLLFQGVGARVPQDVPAPLRAIVWPLWTGSTTVPRWWTGDRFTRTMMAVLAADWVKNLPESRQWRQFLPLILGQLAALFATARMTRKKLPASGPAASASNLAIDQKQNRDRADQDAEDPEAKSPRVGPNSGP
ncbi:MAG: hypothetical protein ACLP7Q_11115 [Isosphaeraceae bacterium]